MFLCHWSYRRNIIKTLFSIIWFILIRWHQRIHVYTCCIILFTSCYISYRSQFGLLYRQSSIEDVRHTLINQHKHEQRIAFEWMENLLKYPENHPNLMSSQTHQSTFYDYLQIRHHPLAAYTLLHKPKQRSFADLHDHIVISILYSKQESAHTEGKFYVGQILYHLLKNYDSRFIITLCENNNTDDQVSDSIKLIRQILPVFIVNSLSDSQIDSFEREKQAYLQCLLANFQSFPKANHLLLLQDDAEPISQNFYKQLFSLIEHRIKQQWPLNGPRQHPGFIKIYHPRWLLGYSHPSLYIIIQLFATSFFLTSLMFICFYIYQVFIETNYYTNQIQQLTYYKKLSLSDPMFYTNLIRNYRRVFCFIFYFGLITFALILVDHSNVSWTWRSLHPTFYSIYPAPSCCLPGVIYFRQTFTQVAEYLNSITCHKTYAIDTALDDLPGKTNLQTYLVEPNLVHHIGLYSRLRKFYISPYLLD